MSFVQLLGASRVSHVKNEVRESGSRSRAAEKRADGECSIGVVVPVYNEAAILASALGRLKAVLAGEAVTVVDGASSDASREIAEKYFPTLLAPRANRGEQMNCGATALDSDVLLFLHADSQLSKGFQQAIRGALHDARVVGGCFRLAFDSPRPMLRFYSWCTRFPGRFLHFGDQAFFVRRQIFQELGGFRSLPLLEDVNFLKRLRKRGRFAILPMYVVTSARRFECHGPVRQMLRNIFLVTLFELGFPAARLTRFYRPVR